MVLISLLIVTVVIPVVCKHAKLKALVTSFPLQHIKQTEPIGQDRFKDVYCTCQMQCYTTAIMLLTLLGMIYKVTSKLLFSNVVKVTLSVSDAHSYVPLKLCKVARRIHLFKLMEKLTPGSITLKRNCIWGELDIDWKEVIVTLNGNKINLSTSVTIQFREIIAIRRLVSKEPLLLHVMLKQERAWFTLKSNNIREEEPITEIV